MKHPMKVYISHEFGGKDDNVNRVAGIIKDLVEKYENIFPISPIHATGFLYHAVSYDRGIEWCLDLLNLCDCMIVFGDKSNSKGCKIEKEFCKENNIPVIEVDDFDRYYKKLFMKCGEKHGEEKEETNE